MYNLLRNALCHFVTEKLQIDVRICLSVNDSAPAKTVLLTDMFQLQFIVKTVKVSIFLFCSLSGWFVAVQL